MFSVGYVLESVVCRMLVVVFALLLFVFRCLSGGLCLLTVGCWSLSVVACLVCYVSWVCGLLIVGCLLFVVRC